MLYSTSESDKSRTQEQRAAIFVDYENLFSHLYSRTGPRARPDELISELLDELRRYLLEEARTQTAMITAYADFSEMHGNGQFIQRGLYLHGIEPRFVPASLQRNAAEIQLCVDAIEILYNRQDVRTFVMVTGDRPYLPLVQQFKRYGCRAIIATFMPPPSTDHLPYVEDDVFLNAHNLLSEASRRSLASTSTVHRGSASYSSSAPSYPQGRPQPVEYREITESGALHALEIIEEHFGQYEEVYLTPLLRKLSELLDDEQYDPKSLISELEDAGAVWLEKRRGFPYDYTVLIIDTEHPDVAAIQKRLYGSRRNAEPVPYTEEEYTEEEYVEDDYADEYVEEYEEEGYSNGTAAEAEEETDAGDYAEDYADAEEEDD